MHLRILPDHQKLFSKKDIFERLLWLKTCFDAFAHTSKPSETFFQKRYSLPSGVVKNVFCCIFAYSQTTRIMSLKKIFFNIWSGFDGFDAFAHTSRPPETFFQKRYFLPSGVVKNVLWCICEYIKTTRNFFQIKIFFTVCSGLRRVLMHLRILPDHQKFFFKDIFYRLEWLKTCFDAFAHTCRPPEIFSKRYFWPPGVVKNVFWCICAYFQTTRIMSLKKIFLTVELWDFAFFLEYW